MVENVRREMIDFKPVQTSVFFVLFFFSTIIRVVLGSRKLVVLGSRKLYSFGNI